MKKREQKKTLPGDFVLLHELLPLLVALHLHHGLLTGSGDGDDGCSRIVLVHVFLDLRQPAKVCLMSKGLGGFYFSLSLNSAPPTF